MKNISNIKFYIALILSFSIIGMMFPYGIPLYSPLVGILFLYTLFKEKKIIFFDRNLIVLYILELSYFIVLVYSNSIYKHVYKDIINIVTINLIIIILINNLKNKNDFQEFYYYFKIIIFISASFIGLIAFYKYILLLNGYENIQFFIHNGDYIWGASLVADYNYFSLGLIIAILFSYKLFQRNSSFIFKLLIINTSSLLTSIVLLSGSRRGFILITLILITFVIIKYLRNTNFIKNNIYFIFSSILTFITVFLLINTDLSSTGTRYNSYELEKLMNRTKTISQYSSIDARIVRWQYALELSNSYSIKEKLFGNGFEYLKLYSIKFGDGKGEGYPHNAIITQALYSGLVGVLLLFVLYYQVLKHYLKYITDLKILFIIFIITTTFGQISGNTFFSSKLSLLLIVLPFVYHFISTREKIEKNHINSTQ